MSNLDLINYDETFSILNSDTTPNYVVVDEKDPSNYIPLEFFETQNDFVLINNNESENINESISNFIIEGNLTDFITNDKILLLTNNDTYSELLQVPDPIIDEANQHEVIIQIPEEVPVKPQECNKFEKQCKCCNQLFTDELSFKLHVKCSDESYQCQICEKNFTQQSNLWKHIRIHTNEKPFKCNGCEKSFSQRSNMLKHQLGHLNERPYSCPHCNQTFIQEVNLSKHLLIHTGEKPFVCEICDRRFSQRSNLVKHKNTHEDIRPLFTCDICSQSFTQKSNLTKHLVIHTKSGTYFCKFCNKGYTQQKNVDKHIITCKVRELYESLHI